MTDDRAEKLQRIRVSFIHNLAISPISNPPTSLEISHLLGNSLGIVRADYISNPDPSLLGIITEGLSILKELSSLDIQFDEATAMFVYGDAYKY